MKVDVYNHEERFKKWKEEAEEAGIPELSEQNGQVLLQYLKDMEIGRNTARSSRKGPRGYARLNTLRQRLSQIMRMLNARGIDPLTNATEEDVAKFFSDMERGTLKTGAGMKYRSTLDYLKAFKAFWHWWIKVNRKSGAQVPDIAEDVGAQKSNPRFVYISKIDLERLIPFFPKGEQVMLMFLFDSIIRAPTELLSLTVKDVYQEGGEVWVNIPDEISKTFGRNFNLLYCGESLLDYIADNDLKSGDRLFKFSPAFFNRKLKMVASQVFGDGAPHPKSDPYKNLSLYDFRHSGTVHLRLLAKENPHLISLDAIRHRGGWADFSMLNYYTQFLGMDGKIEKQGILLKADKHELEKEVDSLKERLGVILKQAGSGASATSARIARLEQENRLMRRQMEEIWYQQEGAVIHA